MRLFGLGRKPDWQHKDAAIRARAVRSSNDPALLPLLPDLAQRDPDAEVRLAAIGRVDDPALLARRMRGEHEPRIAAAARGRLIDRLCATALDLEQRRTVLRDVVDEAVLVAVAERAPETDLRRDALEKLSRPGLLFDRCLADPDRRLRLWLLERIDNPDMLERLAVTARKRDKTLTRAARERLERLQLAAGDPATLARRVHQLCERLEWLSRELPADGEQQLATVADELAGLLPRVEPELVRRAEAFLTLARTTLQAARGGPPQAHAEDTVPAADTVAAAAPEANPAAVAVPAEPDAELDTLAASLPAADDPRAAELLHRIERDARQRREAQPDNPVVAEQHRALADGIAARRAEHQQWKAARQTERRGLVERALTALEAALADDNLSVARDARQHLASLTPDNEWKSRMAAADARLGELERWQRWSGHSVRGRLCDEAEALRGSGMHPDALATRVKELQAEWARLDALEGPGAPPADSGLARRFRALCHAALAPAQGYFDKRRELQQQRAGEVEGLLADSPDALDGSIEALVALRRQVTAGLRELDGVPPQKRGELGRKLRERLSAIDAALAARREQAATDKRRLLARLRRETGSDRAAAVALAKTVQAEWKQLPRADRTVEDALWTELRSLIDPLFAAVRAESDSERQQQRDADAAARAVLSELDELAAAEDDRLLHCDTTLDAMADRWRALAPAAPEVTDPRRGRDGRDDRAPRRRPPAHPQDAAYDAAVTRVQRAREAAVARRAERSMQALCEAGDLLAALRAADAGEAQREAAGEALAAMPLTPEARQALLAQLRTSAGGAVAETTDAEALRAIAVRAELVAGLESPTADAELRRAEQIRRLAHRLEGGRTEPPRQQIAALMLELQLRGGADAGLRHALQQRVMAAYRAVSP